MNKYLYQFFKFLMICIVMILLSCAISISLIHYSAKQGNPRAQATLSYMYFFGTGVEQSKTDSVRWLARAGSSAVRCGIQSVVDTSKNAVKKIGMQASRIIEVFTFTPWRHTEVEGQIR